MEIAVTIEVSGSPGEVGLLLAQLGETLIGEDVTEQLDQTWWTPERAAAFVQELTDPALRALGVIADHAPMVAFRDVQQEMDMTGMQLAGRLSSIGFAVARHGGPVPFDRDYYHRNYYIEPEVATVLSEAISNESRLRASSPRRRRPNAGLRRATPSATQP